MRYKSINQIIFTICLSVVGVFLLLINIGIIPMEIKEAFILFYPFLLFIYGLYLLIEFFFRKKGAFFWAMLVSVFSLCLMLDRFEVIQFGFWDIWKLWPLILIQIGVSLLFKKEIVRIEVDNLPVHCKPSGNHEEGQRVIKISKNKGPTPIKHIKGFSIGDVSMKAQNWALEPINLYNTVGDYFIDFSKAFIPEKETPIIVQGWVGDVKMLVPEDIPVRIYAHIKVGDIRIFNTVSDAVNRKVYFQSTGYEDATRKLDITVKLKVGSIRIDKV